MEIDLDIIMELIAGTIMIYAIFILATAIRYGN